MADETTIADRLAVLEAQLERKRAEADEVHRQLHTPPKHPGGGAGVLQEACYREEKARHERRLRHEAWAREYDAQVAQVAPKVEQLEAKCHGLAAKREELERRQAAEMSKVDADLDRARREINRLTNPPPMPVDPPDPDAAEMVRVDAGGDWGVQYIPKEIYDAQKRRR